MDIKRFLKEVTALPGMPGYEAGVGEYIADWFRPLADELRVDAFGNVVARLGDARPRIMISAHMDEIGLVVCDIEKDGAIRVAKSGGVDPRILPASEVLVHTRTGILPGVVGAKAPHLLTKAEQKKSIVLENLHIDVGMKPESVKAKVRVGDRVTLTGELVVLSGGRLASKTMDDRAGVAVMLVALEHLKRMKPEAEVLFVSSCQEEVGAYGAQTAAHSLEPDIGIAIDVTHGEGPGTGKFEAFPLDKVLLGKGPMLSKPLIHQFEKSAKKHRIDTMVEISNGATWTDADTMFYANEGVPTALVSIPLRYMHTTVETLSEQTIEEAGRLIAHTIDELSRDWGTITWH